jgi:aspartate 1-decarboxylase
MRRRFLKSKLHRATVTDSNLKYVGSVSLGPELMSAADIMENEQVTVLNINNCGRFETYAIRGGTGEVCLNGAAARLGQPGDILILLTYCELDEHETDDHEPTVVLVGPANRIEAVQTGGGAAAPPAEPIAGGLE